jgi:heptosyltransferase I
VIINVGAAWETKRWTADKWASVLSGLKTPDIFPLILWGTDIELGIARDLAAKTGAVPAPFMSIPEVLALIKQSDLLLSGDTFALQAACALGTPVVGIFGPTSPARNGPFGPRDKTLHLPIPCHPCYKRECSRLECLNRLDPGRVAEQAEKVLKDNDGSSNR